MRHKLIVLCTAFLFLLFASPAWADVNLNVNGSSYVPFVAPQISNGTTMVPLNVIGRIIGAEIDRADSTITVTKDSQTLNLQLNRTDAVLDGKQLTMPQAPTLVGGEVMVPLRFICETFGATVTWDQNSRTAGVLYSEQRQGMTPEEILAKSSEAMLKFNTYKTRAALSMEMGGAIPSVQEETVKVPLNMGMDMAIQNDPLLIYGQTTVDFPGAAEMPELAAPIEVLLNEEGMFMTMPGEEGWFRTDVPGMDMKELIEQSRNQDPVASLEMLQESGAIISFSDDQEKHGRSYWVVNVTLGTDSFNELVGKVMNQAVNIPGMEADQDLILDYNDMMETLFKNMKADVVYRVWVDQASMVTTYMDLDALIELYIPGPVIEDGTFEPIVMYITERATFEIYDLGKPFSVPDVSQAKDLSQYMDGVSISMTAP
jgi:hypothetical protein